MSKLNPVDNPSAFPLYTKIKHHTFHLRMLEAKSFNLIVDDDKSFDSEKHHLRSIYKKLDNLSRECSFHRSAFLNYADSEAYYLNEALHNPIIFKVVKDHINLKPWDTNLETVDHVKRLISNYMNGSVNSPKQVVY